MKASRYSVTLNLLIGSTLVAAGCGDSGLTADTAGAAETVVAAAQDCAGAPALRASGSTAQQNAIEQFVFAFVRACPGRTLAYEANGSAAGVEDFLANQTDLAGSDLALDPARDQPERAATRCGSPAWHLPVVFNPIAISYHLPGVSSLTLDAPTAAKIFNGTVSTWDNAAIKALNPGVALPAAAIHVIYHSDRSGSTAALQRYLDDASDGVWTGGAGETFNGSGDEGASGDDGAVAALQDTGGSITYSLWSAAQGRQLQMARIVTAADRAPVAISTDSVGKALARATFAAPGNDLVLDSVSLHKPSDAGAYPVVLATYEIVCSKYPDPQIGAAVKAFLRAALDAGQDGLDQYGAVPLPEPVKSRLLGAVRDVS